MRFKPKKINMTGHNPIRTTREDTRRSKSRSSCAVTSLSQSPGGQLGIKD